MITGGERLNMKRIIVACGSGIATSGMVASKINSMLEDRGYADKAVADTADIKSLDLVIQSADIYVDITSSADDNKYNIPTFSGIPFLTGIGAEKVMDEIIKLL
jgi:PTS system galactitol-specific IIB component